MSYFERADPLTITTVERLERSPYNPSEDREYWRVVADGITLNVYVTGTDSVQVPTDAAQAKWIADRVQDRARAYDVDAATLSAMQPLQLRP